MTPAPRTVPRRTQRGSVAVEAALALPILLGIGFIGADMHRVGIERARIEQQSGIAAVTLAAQSRLTREGLDALADVLMQGHPERYQIEAINVQASGVINWSLRRGAGGDLCPALGNGRTYNGPLPEDPPEAAGGGAQPDADPAGAGSPLSMVLVQVCRSTRDITLTGGLVLPDPLRVRSVNRTRVPEIGLDSALQDESRSNAS